MHLLVYQIKNAWRQQKVVSALFLDIEGAFPNAVTDRLLHNMQMRRVPTDLIQIVANTLQNRKTRLCFDDYMSEPITLTNGIGQGDPLSMLLFLYYNADILDIPKNKGEHAMAFVDDSILIASGKDFDEMHQTLRDMMTREGGAMDWAKRHNSKFEYSKLALIDFAHH
jgi:hypothetical protein